MTAENIEGLHAGDEHFMAYVGPPSEYDVMAATQFNLLTTMGLRSRHRLLDVGCGSLRGGRLLISYLDPGNYYGIEPNEWLVQEGIAKHFGPSVLETKKPHFAHNSEFDASEFDTKFDVLLAQSILSHTGWGMAVEALTSFAGVLEAHGVAYVTFGDRDAPLEPDETRADGWLYPDIIRYHVSEVEAMAAEAGLHMRRLKWFHPRQVWYAFALDPAALPRGVARTQRGFMPTWPRSAGPRKRKPKNEAAAPRTDPQPASTPPPLRGVLRKVARRRAAR